MARNCSGMERTGCNASLARRVKIDTSCEESGGITLVKFCRPARRASDVRLSTLSFVKVKRKEGTNLLLRHVPMALYLRQIKMRASGRLRHAIAPTSEIPPILHQRSRLRIGATAHHRRLLTLKCSPQLADQVSMSVRSFWVYLQVWAAAFTQQLARIRTTDHTFSLVGTAFPWSNGDGRLF
jgi:hypothetical protein